MAQTRSGPQRLARGRWKSRGQQSGPPEGEPTPRQVDKPQPESAVSSSHNTLPSVPPAAELAAVAKLFANTADGVWVSGKEGEILFWNQAAETIMGYPAEQVVGRCCRDVFGGCDANGNRVCGWPCPIKTLLHGGDLVEHFDMATQTKTGQPLWIDVSCVAVPSADNGPPTIVHLFRDVTAAHQIELLVRQQLAQTKLKLTTSQEVLAPIGELSQRELQVITVMRTGASTAAIADQLCISKATVRNHIQNIFSKLKVHTRLEAVACVNRIARLEPTGSIDIGWAADPTKEDDKVPAEGRTRQAR